MMPVNKFDFDDTDTLSRIRKHQKLKDGKYGHRSNKRVKIKLLKGFYLVDSYFVDYLMEKFGNVPFRTAINKYDKEMLDEKI